MIIVKENLQKKVLILKNHNPVLSVLLDRKSLNKNKFEIDRFVRYANNNIYC